MLRREKQIYQLWVVEISHGACLETLRAVYPEMLYFVQHDNEGLRATAEGLGVTVSFRAEARNLS